MTLWRKREQLDLRVSLVTYLYTAARNRALTHLRHKRVVWRWEHTRARFTSKTGAPADDDVLEAELARGVQEAVARLPDRTRMVFTMSRQQQMTYGQIAEMLAAPRELLA